MTTWFPEQGCPNCAVAGVCLLAVIIPAFVNNFMLFYSYSKVWDRNRFFQYSEKVKINQVQTIENFKMTSEFKTNKEDLHFK